MIFYNNFMKINSQFIKILLIIFIFSLFSYSLVFSQKDFAYFSFQKNGDKYLIGIEADFSKYKPDLLNYEWVLFFEGSQATYETHKPLLRFESKNKLLSGKVRIYSNDLSFDKKYSFVFKQKNLPAVSIVRYLEELNVVLPFGRIEKNEKLFPLTFNFSSDNLSIAWNVFNKFYYSLLFDPEGLENGSEIKVIVTNIDNPIEFSSDQIKIEK